MASPEETYRAAILQACEAHLARVKAARDALVLAVSSAKNFGEHDPRRLTIYVEANKKYEKAIRNSDAQRAKDDAERLAAFKTTGEAGVEHALAQKADLQSPHVFSNSLYRSRLASRHSAVLTLIHPDAGPAT